MRGAQFDAEDRLLRRRAEDSTPNYLSAGHPPDQLQQRLLDVVWTLADHVLEGIRPDAVCLAFPGPVGPDGAVLAAPTVAGNVSLPPFALHDACRTRWPGARVIVTNDVTANGYRYVDRGHRDFCIITVGSGIGHKVFIDGSPQVGTRGRGGEIGHLRVDFREDAPACDCGGRGHLGGIASGRGVLRVLRQRALEDPSAFRDSSVSRTVAAASDLDNRILAEAFRCGDPWVRRVVHEAAAHLGHALAAIHLTLGTEEMIVVGGFARALGEPYRAMLVEAASSASWDLGQDWDGIVRLGLPDDDGGLIGGGLLLLAAERS